MGFDIQASQIAADKSRAARAGSELGFGADTGAGANKGGAAETGGGCQCPYCGRTIPSEELQAQGYAPAQTEADKGAGAPDADDPAGYRESAGGYDNDDAGIVAKFNASRPGPLQADAGRAAGLLSAARRMVKNKDY